MDATGNCLLKVCGAEKRYERAGAIYYDAEKGSRTPSKPPSEIVANKQEAVRHCSTVVDVAELLGRHARAYGTTDAAFGTLPRTVRMEEELAGKKGVAELVLDKSVHRWEELIGGVHHASGTDANGAWVVGIAGVPLRLRPAEATAVLFDPWFARRAYLSAFDAKRDTASCSEGDRDTPGARVRLRYVLPELGVPEIEFDLTTAALLSASAAASDGKRTITQYDAWSDADASGVRWPSAMTTGDPAGNRRKYRVIESVARLACKGVGAKAPAGDCLAMPTPALEIAWPPSGIVKVPMKYYLGELSLRVRTGDREAWALLDSGAGLTVVDSTTPAGMSFVSSLEINGSGSSQKVRAGLGELSKLRIGDLTLTHLPAASIPIPALDPFGNRRPEIIIGFSLFLGAAVRVDYAKNEIAFARTAGALVKPGTPSVSLRVLEGKPVADVTVDGVSAPFVTDTGNSGGIDMVKRWAAAHGLPGERPTTMTVAKTGAGNNETASTLFRLAKSKLGPIEHDDRIVWIHDPPEPGVIAGLVGNEVFSRCAAVVFDVAMRTLWFEPPCNRPSPEAKAGWRLAKNESPQQKDRPWVIEKLIPKSSAVLAGFEIGDRLLSVGGVPVEADVSNIQPILEQADGTKVTVVLDRNGERKQIVMVLRRLLSP